MWFGEEGKLPLFLLDAVLLDGLFFRGKLMPFDSEGNFTRIHNWESDRQADIDIVSDRHDEEDDNFANALNDCMLRDGRATMQGDLKMGNFQIKQVANGTVGTDAVNRGQMDTALETLKNSIIAALNQSSKLGDVKASLQMENHDNWLLCNGQAVKRSDYSALFALIGTKFGSGDGVNTFNVPDYRGKFLRGLGGNSAADVQTTQAEGLPNITGNFATAKNGAAANSIANGAFAKTADYSTWYGQGSHADAWGGYVNLDASRSSNIYGASTHVTPINQAVNYFIKAREEK